MRTAVALMMILGTFLSTGLAAEALPPGLTPEAVAGAKTPGDHQAIADAYAKEAEQLRAQAMAHRQMDSHYNEPGYLSSKLGLQRHCRRRRMPTP